MPDHTSNPPFTEEDPWLTVQQVSEELQVHPATVRVWVRTGRLAAQRVGRVWRVRRSEVDRALRFGASPAYGEQHEARTSEGERSSSPTPAPRQIADHIMTVAPDPGGRS